MAASLYTEFALLSAIETEILVFEPSPFDTLSITPPEIGLDSTEISSKAMATSLDTEFALLSAIEILDLSPFGTLGLIPPELRVEIYQELVAEESVRFLETSKAIYNEAIDIFLQEGVCRLEFNKHKSLKIFPGQDCAKTIRNLVVRLDLTHFLHTAPNKVSTCIKIFNKWLTRCLQCGNSPQSSHPPAPLVPRKSCEILLDCSLDLDATRLPYSTFDKMRFLTSFETVVFAVACKGGFNPQTKYVRMQRVHDPRPDPRRQMHYLMHTKARNEDMVSTYEQAREALEPTLGPAERICDEYGEHLEFHPRAYNFGEVEDRQV